MTAQILVNMLDHGYIKMSNINLILMDECHNASGNHPYAQVMEVFHLPCHEKPHIMGLTASIINKKPKQKDMCKLHEYLERSMKNLEILMQSACLTCSDPMATARYATRPDEKVLACSAAEGDKWEEMEKMVVTISDVMKSALTFMGKKQDSSLF